MKSRQSRVLPKSMIYNWKYCSC